MLHQASKLNKVGNSMLVSAYNSLRLSRGCQNRRYISHHIQRQSTISNRFLIPSASSSSNTLGQQCQSTSLLSLQKQTFFGRNKKYNEEKKQEEQDTEKKTASDLDSEAKDKFEEAQKDHLDQEQKQGAQAETYEKGSPDETHKEDKDEVDSGDKQKTEDADGAADQDKEKSSSSSSDESGPEEDGPEGEAKGGLSAQDVKRIKKLFKEQEQEIETLEKTVKDLQGKLNKSEQKQTVIDKLQEQLADQKSEVTRTEKEIKLARIEYTKQIKENEQTVQRYRKMIEDEKSFAISKFSKDLLEVRDAIRMALENTDVEQIKAQEDLEVLKQQFEAQLEGSAMTAAVFDKCLERFNVVQYDPKGEPFDPKLHEAVFTVAKSEQENDTVAIVMQTGWKIGDRILRAAKVGIVKK